MFSKLVFTKICTSLKIELPICTDQLPDTIESFSEVVQFYQFFGYFEFVSMLRQRQYQVLSRIAAVSQTAVPSLNPLHGLLAAYTKQADMRQLLCCPLSHHLVGQQETLRLMRDPVTTPWGDTFDRMAFGHIWEHVWGDEPIPEGWLVPNLKIKALAKAFLEGKTLEEVDFDDLFSDPISETPMTNMVLDVNGNTYELKEIYTWLSKETTCPMNPDRSCSVDSLRPNRLLNALQTVYKTMPKSTLDYLRFIHRLSEQVTGDSKALLKRMEKHLKFLVTPNDEHKFVNALSDIILHLEPFYQLLIYQLPYLPSCQDEITEGQALDICSFLHQKVSGLIMDHHSLTTYHWKTLKQDYLHRLQVFSEQISLQHKCLAPNDAILFANVFMQTDINILGNFILRNELAEASHRYQIVIEAKKPHRDFAQKLATIIAGKHVSLIYAYADKVNIQFKFATEEIDRCIVAFHHLQLMSNGAHRKLKRIDPSFECDLETLSHQADKKEMIAQLNKLVKAPGSSAHWRHWLPFFGKKAPECERSDLSNLADTPAHKV